MKLKCLTLVLLMLCLLTGIAMSATVGRITGVITDAQTKEPLIGVSVQIVGTTMGAQTNEHGQYSIINVPVGTYTVRMSAVGYATVEVNNVEVSADLATYQNETLSSQAADIGKTIQVTTERPLVIKDQTSSINIVRRDQILAMPTRGFEQVVGIQSGVVKMNPNATVRFRGAREATQTGELDIRGGRPSEVAYYVDGFSQQDPLSGNSTANIANNAIKEVSVLTGGFPAEYGLVSSGIVNTITQSGTDVFHANLEGVTDNKLTNYDQNFYSGDVSGPIPGLKKAYFFFSGERRWLGDRNPSAITKDLFSSYNVFTANKNDLQRLPSNSSAGWSYQGKIDYSLTPNLKLQLMGNGSDDRWREFQLPYLFDIQHGPQYHDQNLGLNAKLTHTLNANTFYNLSASYFDTRRFRGDGLLGENIFAYGRPNGNPRFDSTSLFWSWDNPATPHHDTVLTVDGKQRSFPIVEKDADGNVIAADEGSVWDDYYKRRSQYYGFRGDVTSQLSHQHTVKAGVEFQRHTLRYYRNLFPSLSYLGVSGKGFQDVDRYGYDIYGNQADPSGFENATKHPINFAAYLQDRAEYQGLIVNAGLRFDYFNYKSQRLVDPFHPLDPTTQTITAARLQPAKNFTKLSPRIGIAFPISDRTQMHLNYGKFYQRPDLVRLYTGYDFFAYKVLRGGYFYPIGNPNLEPEQTTAYELGISHQLGDRASVEATVFYKDINNLVQVASQPSYPNSFTIFKNGDYGTVKGFEFNFNLRRTQHIELNAKYTLQWAMGTGSYANTLQNIAWTASVPPKFPAPLDFDQRHNLIGIIDYRLGKGEGPVLGSSHFLENFGINAVIQLASGTPYTPAEIFDEVTLANVAPVPVAPRNTAYGPFTFNIDLKAERAFGFGKYQITPYVLVRNLLDRKNAYVVYESSGQPNVTGWLNTPPGQDFAGRYATPDASGLTGEQKYLLKQDNPQNYGLPRMVLVGLRMSF